VDQYRDMRDRVLVVLEAALAPKTYYTLLDAIRAITVERSEMIERLLIFEELVRDIMLLKESAEGKLIHYDVRSRLAPLAERVSHAALQNFYSDLLEAREAILKINANIGLSLQALLLPLRES